jgi:hypothetical protein
MNIGDMTVAISCVGSGAQKLSLVAFSAIASIFAMI